MEEQYFEKLISPPILDEIKQTKDDNGGSWTGAATSAAGDA